MTGEVTKYRPSNGTEGDAFISRWCAKCSRDRMAREDASYDDCQPEELCDILTRTFIHRIDEPEYPVEWIRDDTGPRCTAFDPIREKGVTPRCNHTKDMFEPEGGKQ